MLKPMIRVLPPCTVDDIAVFVDDTDLPFDPSEVLFNVYNPDGTIDNYEYGVDSNVVRISVGRYRGRFTVAEGRSETEWIVTTGTAVGVGGSVVMGEQSVFM